MSSFVEFLISKIAAFEECVWSSFEPGCSLSPHCTLSWGFLAFLVQVSLVFGALIQLCLQLPVLAYGGDLLVHSIM